ncbi:Uncharacterised protein [Bordetella pertussis]|nr:Uncharacterised protein [Bordetella pertussis]
MACATTSSSPSNRVTASTGPKISSRTMVRSGRAHSKMVGSM